MGQFRGDFHARQSSLRIFHSFRGHLQQESPGQPQASRRPPQTGAKGKVAIVLALLFLGAGTATAAFMVSHRAQVAGPTWVQSATFVSLPGILTVEDALY
jgi:hypothetical protein